jgi:ribosomal protein S17
MKVFTGIVIKKNGKTATVVVESDMVHPTYKKRYKVMKKYHVHDELGVTVGQTVHFVASKPYSKMKKWKITKLVGDDKKSKNKQNKKTRKKKGSKK